MAPFADIQKENYTGRHHPNKLASIQQTKAPTGDPEGDNVFEAAGRVTSVRRSGKYLVFLEISDGGARLQVQFNLSKLPGVTREEFIRAFQQIRRGDHIHARGERADMNRQEVAQKQIVATSLPNVLTPCLHPLPVEQRLEHRDISKESTTGRHVEMLTYPDFLTIMKARSIVVKSLRQKLDSDGFLEVQTPILSAGAGGATARPFLTSATEFPSRKLALRVAPELWLKRLAIGGVSRVFEMGPCFRNEGLDRTHNPEFMTCEFYAAYLDIDRLKRYTEQIFGAMASMIRDISAREGLLNRTLVKQWGTGDFKRDRPFKEICFFEGIKQSIGRPLPNLDSTSARDEILAIFEEQSVPTPRPATLPRLLDKLSSQFLEPQCQDPTWIINLPECLSPLSKSFVHPTIPNEQKVAARAELFMKCKEVVNCYEEENSPVEQRRKFVDQQRYARDPDSNSVDDEAMEIDEDYINALEWGLPPTGGWGCGIDRLVMLVTGQERIGDVLSLGNLRAVTRNAEKWEKTEQDKGSGSIKEDNKVSAVSA